MGSWVVRKPYAANVRQAPFPAGDADITPEFANDHAISGMAASDRPCAFARGSLQAAVFPGSVISKRVIPFAEDTVIVPPWAATIDFVIASPRPVPPLERCLEGSTR